MNTHNDKHTHTHTQAATHVFRNPGGEHTLSLIRSKEGPHGAISGPPAAVRSLAPRPRPPFSLPRFEKQKQKQKRDGFVQL